MVYTIITSDYIQQNLSICSFDTSNSWVVLSPIEQRIKEKIERIGTPLKDWDINIYRGVLTGYNEAFIISGAKKDELIAKDPKSAEIIRPILRGRDIKRYGYDFADLWLINTYNGVKEKGIKRIQIEDYPAIKEHLDQYWVQIEKRADQGDTPYNLRNCAYMDDFNKQKIVYSDITERLSFCLCNELYFCNNTIYFMVSNGNANFEYLLNYLNSYIVDWYYKTLSVQLGEKAVRLFSIYVLNIPIPINGTDNVNESYELSKDEVEYIESIYDN